MLTKPGIRKSMKLTRKLTNKKNALPPTEKAGGAAIKRKRIYKFTKPNV